MWKFYIIAVLFFSGCSQLTFNATMCNQIASDPNAVVPEECRIYNEEEAQKAFENNKNQTTTSDEDIIEFNKNDKDK